MAFWSKWFKPKAVPEQPAEIVIPVTRIPPGTVDKLHKSIKIRLDQQRAIDLAEMKRRVHERIKHRL